MQKKKKKKKKKILPTYPTKKYGVVVQQTNNFLRMALLYIQMIFSLTVKFQLHD